MMHGKMRKLFIGSGMLLLFFFVLGTGGMQSTAAGDTSAANQEIMNEQERQLAHEDITRLTDQFMDLLVQDIDTDYKVKNFDTKEELLQAFDTITNRETASEYVDTLFVEKSDGLYAVPTETPPWFMKENEYDMIQLDNNRIKVVQDNYTALHGNYRVEFEFTYNQGWKITDVVHK